MYSIGYTAEGVSVGHIFVRVFARVFVVVFVWVGLNITWFNLGRLDQSTTCIHKAQNTRLYAISDLREQERVCGSELVGMIVRDEWMCCGVDVVCV